MKLFLFIVFLGFYHSSIAVGNHHTEHGKGYVTGISKNEAAQPYEQDFYATLSPALIYVKSFKNSPHHRNHNATKDFCNVQSSTNDTRYFNDTFFVARYSYCKPIGLFLIFPQHYFW